ncbi:hypothetical protein NEOLEDRAFT_393342 [Neolentinus lepideus HHB14362 ss-1]|uniref:Uncharacterized protein n=1 Tax=Neolentinus lepideus HHB14362 ss-1 TaxID=1314782 RepID=A0A165S7X9_9AGAM|nr:hypothetical protein NEOLEDRAFT_393342 [Neolentinus lepideus HHB14362 ss-1]
MSFSGGREDTVSLILFRCVTRLSRITTSFLPLFRGSLTLNPPSSPLRWQVRRSLCTLPLLLPTALPSSRFPERARLRTAARPSTLVHCLSALVHLRTKLYDYDRRASEVVSSVSSVSVRLMTSQYAYANLVSAQ